MFTSDVKLIFISVTYARKNLLIFMMFCVFIVSPATVIPGSSTTPVACEFIYVPLSRLSVNKQLSVIFKPYANEIYVVGCID